MKCPKCGTEVEGKDKFCPECGANLQAEATKESPAESAKKEEAPPPTAQVSQPTQVTAPPPQPSAPAPAPKKKNTCLIIAIILIVLLLCCGATAAGVIYGGKYLGLKLFTSAKEEAYKATCQANQRNMMSGIASYYAEKGTYPTSLNELVPTYMPKMYNCPAGGKYTYDEYATHRVGCTIKGHTVPNQP